MFSYFLYYFPATRGSVALPSGTRISEWPRVVGIFSLLAKPGLDPPPDSPLPTVALSLRSGWREIQLLGSGQLRRVWGRSLGVESEPVSRENPKTCPAGSCQGLLPEAVELDVGSARQELLTARFLGHHPGCPASSQALGVEWGEGGRHPKPRPCCLLCLGSSRPCSHPPLPALLGPQEHHSPPGTG